MQRSQRVVRNISSTLITQLFSWGVTLFMLPYVARYVGSIGSGRLGVTTSYGAVFSIFYGIVSGFVLVRDIARDPKRLPELVCASLVMRLPIALFTIVIGTAVAYFFGGPLHFDSRMVVLLSVGLFCVMFGQINDILVCALRGVEEFPKVNGGQLAEKVAVNVATVVFILFHRQIEWIQGATIVSQSVQMLINLRSLRPYWSGFVVPTKAAIVSLFTQSIPFITTTLFIALYSQTDPLYIHLLATDQVAGWYNIPNKFLGSCLMVPVAIASATLPTLSRLYHEDESKFARFVSQIVGLMYIAVIPFSTVLIFAPGPILRILGFTHDFDGAIPAISVGGFTIIVWFLSQVTGTALIASDRQNVLSRATGMAAAVSIPSCLSLVWIFQRTMHNGAVGATLSDAVVEIMMLRSYIRALPEGCMRGFSFRQLLGAVAAAVPIVLPLYFFHLGKLSILIALPGLIAYLPLCILFRAVEKSEVQQLAGLLRSKGSPDIVNVPVETLDGGSAAVVEMEAAQAELEPADPQLVLELGWVDLVSDEQNWRRPEEQNEPAKSGDIHADEAA